jgi:drug/metabolite transporter (DMT)-like permease
MIAFGSVLGHGLMNWSLVRIPLWIGSTFTLLSPVASAAVAWIALGEALNWTQVTGMVLVLVSLGVIVRGQATRVPDVVDAVAA